MAEFSYRFELLTQLMPDFSYPLPVLGICNLDVVGVNTFHRNGIRSGGMLSECSE